MCFSGWMLVTGSSRDRFLGDRINNYAFHVLFLFLCSACVCTFWYRCAFCFLVVIVFCCCCCCRMNHTLKQYNCPRSENKIKIHKRVKRTTFNRTAQTMLLAQQGREQAMKARQLHRPTTGTGQLRIVTSCFIA